MPVTSDYRGDKFFVRENGVRMATPLFVVLLLVEISDVIFAVDSIPAIFAVTTDPFIVYTSNVFAILGLRSLYFALAGVMDKFHYLKIGLGVVLTFVGVKMLLAHTAWKIDTLRLARRHRAGPCRVDGDVAAATEENRDPRRWSRCPELNITLFHQMVRSRGWRLRRTLFSCGDLLFEALDFMKQQRLGSLPPPS